MFSTTPVQCSFFLWKDSRVMLYMDMVVSWCWTGDIECLRCLFGGKIIPVLADITHIMNYFIFKLRNKMDSDSNDKACSREIIWGSKWARKSTLCGYTSWAIKQYQLQLSENTFWGIIDALMNGSSSTYIDMSSTPSSIRFSTISHTDIHQLTLPHRLNREMRQATNQWR